MTASEVARTVVVQLASMSLAFTLPNAAITPGAVGPEAGAAPAFAAVCTRGFSRTVRHRYDREWRRYRTAIFRAYGLPHAVWRNYTIDHLVPLELDGRPFGLYANGAPDVRNVWPEPKAEAIEKDAVEDALHAAVCYRRGYRGQHLSLSDAQTAIAHDWTRTPVGLPRPRSSGRD